MEGRAKLYSLAEVGDFKTLFTFLNLYSYDDFYELIAVGKIFRTKIKDRSGKPQTKTLPVEKQKAFWKYFWDNYIFNSSHKERIYGDEDVIYLKTFFSGDETLNSRILEILATKYPKQLIKAVRLKRSFIKDAHFNSLKFLSNHSNEFLSNHFQAFTLLKEKERRLYAKASGATEIDMLSISQWIYLILFHYEWQFRKLRKQHEDNDLAALYLSNHVKLFQVVKAYNAFISFLISKLKTSTELTWQDAIRSHSKLVEDFLENKLPEYFRVIDNWLEWYKFIHDELDTYCFDLNYEVDLINREKLRFYPVDKLNRSLIYIGELRLAMFHSNINKQLDKEAINLNLKQIKTNREEFEKVENKVLAVARGMFFNVNILKAAHFITKYSLDAVDEDKMNRLVIFLSRLMMEGQVDYRLAFNSLENDNLFDWFLKANEIVYKLLPVELVPGRYNYPIYLDTPEKFDQLYYSTTGPTQNDSEWNRFLVYDTNKRKDYFDRFEPFYNIYQTPFLLIDKTVLSIKPLLADMDPAIVILESVMKTKELNRSNVQKQETDLQEVRLAEMFLSAGFSNVCCSVYLYDETKNNVGEIDLIATHENEVLLIQLKRSRLQLTPSELRTEYYEVINLAGKQLEENFETIMRFPSCMNFPKNEKVFKQFNFTIDDTTLKNSNLHGCVLSMYPHWDATMIKNKFVKTSFIALNGILNKCSSEKGNKVLRFMKEASEPLIPFELLADPKINFDFEIPIT